MKTAHLLSLAFLVFSGNAFPQGSYFKIIEQPYTSLFQRMAEFPDGSVLVGDRLTLGPTISSDYEFYLAKFDPCGELEWSKYFKPPGDRMLFDAIEISDLGEIFVMGTDIKNLDETLFLMKMDAQGEVLRYLHFPGPWYEMFTYSLDYRPGRVMVSGLLIYPDNSKTGAVFMFDEDLEPLWAKQWEPFEAYGETVMTHDGGALASSGNQVLRFGAQGQLLWGQLVGDPTVPQFSAPVEIVEGFIFEENSNTESQLFLLHHDGSFGWQSEKFPARATVDGLSALPGGGAVLFYNDTGNQPSQLRVSPSGEIFQQKRLDVGYPLHASFMYHTLAPNGTVQVFGQANADFQQMAYHFDFLARFPLDGPTDGCFSWENFTTTSPNTSELPIQPLVVTVTEADLQLEERPMFNPPPVDVVEKEICPLATSTTVLRQDTLLDCDETWKVTLPHPAFIWQDSSSENPRLLAEPGSYRASMVECRDTTVLEFSLEMRCTCNVFFPNAISPNGDGLNDELRPFSNCGFAEMQLDVYDRWGGRMFRSDDIAAFWDGNFKGKPVTAGVYVARLRYRMVDALGVEREGEVVQEVVVTQ